MMLAIPLTMCCTQTEQPIEQGYGLASAEMAPMICADEQTRERVRDIMSNALDRALENHIVHMFEVWMRDGRDQPARARTGVTNGVIAYIQARKGVAAWSPIACP